ncbi:MAG TPA: sigma-54 dependent transcriptional regulator [Candidatus Methylomirabilis sp.]|nr:sigma-54 dependent transcriptional regulator [Candidatus Methylomirabilis sp.]
MATILLVDDDPLLRGSLAEDLGAHGHEVAVAETGAHALSFLEHLPIDLLLADLRLPDVTGIALLHEVRARHPEVQVVIMTAFGDIPTAVKAIQDGAYHFLPKPFDLEELHPILTRALETQRLRREVATLRAQQFGDSHIPGLLGESRATRDLRLLIRRVAATPRTSILVVGESGTGKEVVANAIHAASARAAGPMVKVNCSAIPETLLEADLFGYEKGAFTDAKAAKKGLFELANGGTIFLDEISDMALPLQPKLLRVLDEQVFRRVGGLKDIRVDVRVIAATNRDLAALVQAGRFRGDLYYRLRVMEVFIPPLRSRPEDIRHLAHHFLAFYNREFGTSVAGFDRAAESLLTGYGWPGNVRELKNVIERAAILADGDLIVPALLPQQLQASAATLLNGEGGIFLPPALSLEEVEKQYLRTALKAALGNRSEAARRLGITRVTLRAKIRRYGLA